MLNEQNIDIDTIEELEHELLTMNLDEIFETSNTKGD